MGFWVLLDAQIILKDTTVMQDTNHLHFLAPQSEPESRCFLPRIACSVSQCEYVLLFRLFVSVCMRECNYIMDG